MKTATLLAARLGALALALAAPASAQVEAQAEAARVVRILPLGDSITHGGNGFASYRYPLRFALERSPHLVDFVGRLRRTNSESPPFDPNPASYPLYHVRFDREHEGRWGWRTDQVFAVAVGAAEAGRPDVVLVHLGTNDVGQSGSAGVTSAQQNLPRILDAFRSVRPATTVLLAQVVPIGPGTSYFANAAHVPSLNAAIAQIAAQKTSAASPVVLVDQFTGFDVAGDMQSDGLHPNLSGERRMAGVWRAALTPWLAPYKPPPTPGVVLLDAGFEIGLTDGQVVGTPAGIAWGYGATPNVSLGVFNPTSATYTGAAGSGTPAGAEGDEVGYLYTPGGASERASLFQTLATTLEPNTVYTLTVAVGNRLPGNPYGPSLYGGYRIELLAGNEVVASDADSMTPPAGAFADAVVVFDSAGADPRLVGEALTLRFSMTSTAALSSTDFDRVRLTAQ